LKKSPSIDVIGLLSSCMD